MLWADLEAFILSAVHEFFKLSLFRGDEWGVFGRPAGKWDPGVVEYLSTQVRPPAALRTHIWVGQCSIAHTMPLARRVIYKHPSQMHTRHGKHEFFVKPRTAVVEKLLASLFQKVFMLIVTVFFREAALYLLITHLYANVSRASVKRYHHFFAFVKRFS